jgi:outer membrane receptor protein involved in Fe transport
MISSPTGFSAIALLAALIAPLPAVSAQESAPDDAAPANDDIIVTALPPPPAAAAYGGQTISGDALAVTASGRLEEALARIPGFQQFRRSDSRSANVSAQGITLRAIGGNASSRTLLLLDGVPVADPFFGFVPFTALPTDTIASARVTRGSGVGPFGAGAVAGTIELVSLSPADRPRLALGATIGSDDAREAVLGIALPLGAGHIAIDARHDAGDGFFTTPVEQRVPATARAGYRASQIALSAAIPLGASGALHPRIALFRDERTLRFAGADNGAEGVDASLRYVGTGAVPVEALAYVQVRDFSSVVVSATSFRATLDQRATPTTGWGGKIELRPLADAARLLRIGVDVRGGEGRADEDVLSAATGMRTLSRSSGGRSLVAGAFVEGDAVLGALSLTGGARIDHWRLSDGFAGEVRPDGSVQSDRHFADRSGTIASFRGAARWQLAEVLALRASAYSGFRVPTLNELYRGFTIFPVVTRANAGLDPERVRGAEAAVELQPAAGVTMTVTAFDNRLSDAIANVTIGPNLRERRNVAAIRARGVEAALGMERGPWRFDAGWAYSDARVRAAADDAAAAALDGLRPAQTPRHSGSATLAWARGGWLVQGGMRHVGAAFEDDRNIDVLPAATTIDALVRVPVGRGFALVLRAENLADETVITRNAAGSIDLGAPRTYWLGLRFGG